MIMGALGGSDASSDIATRECDGVVVEMRARQVSEWAAGINLGADTAPLHMMLVAEIRSTL